MRDFVIFSAVDSNCLSSLTVILICWIWGLRFLIWLRSIMTAWSKSTPLKLTGFSVFCRVPIMINLWPAKENVLPIGSLEPKSWSAREWPITADFKSLSWIKLPDLRSRFKIGFRSELVARIVADSTMWSPVAVSWRIAIGAIFLILSLDSFILTRSSAVRFELLKWKI